MSSSNKYFIAKTKIFIIQNGHYFFLRLTDTYLIYMKFISLIVHYFFFMI